MQTVSFVILHYGDVEPTRLCVESIHQLRTDNEIHIVIVDNDVHKSQEERRKLQQMTAQFTDIHVIQMKEDSGFSKANNVGYQYTREKHHPDCIIVTNNDITFEQEDFLIRLDKAAKETGSHVISPDVFSSAGRVHQSPIDTTGRTLQQVNYTIRMNTICLKLFPVCYPLLCKSMGRNAVKQDSVGWNEKQEDIVPCGACIIVLGEFIQKEEKIFDPETRFYYEEYILHNRCKRKGYKIVYVPDLQVIHADGVATMEKSGNERNRIRHIMSNTLQSAKVYKKLLEYDR